MVSTSLRALLSYLLGKRGNTATKGFYVVAVGVFRRVSYNGIDSPCLLMSITFKVSRVAR